MLIKPAIEIEYNFLIDIQQTAKLSMAVIFFFQKNLNVWVGLSTSELRATVC